METFSALLALVQGIHRWPVNSPHKGQWRGALIFSLICAWIGKTPVRIILWCPTTIMLIKACFLIQPLEQEGGCQKCCLSLCSKLFIKHLYQRKASPECINILLYWTKYWVDRLRSIPRRKVWTGISYQQIYRLGHYILHQVAHSDCSAPSGKQHEPLTRVWGINGWVNNREADDLRRHRAHYDVTIIYHKSDVAWALTSLNRHKSPSTQLTIVTKRHLSSALLRYVKEIHRRPMDSHHKGLIILLMLKTFPYRDLIM